MKKIRFSAGHGAGKTYNRGGLFFNEGDENLVFTDLLRKKLNDYEVDAKEIRNERGRTTDYSLSARSSFGSGADLFYSSHSNAGGGRGVEVYLSYQSLNYYEFAKELTEVISKTLGIPNRGVKFRNYNTGRFETYRQARSSKNNWYGELRNNRAKCAIIVEHFFHDSKSDSQQYLGNKDKLATNIVKVIAKHFNLKSKNGLGKSSQTTTSNRKSNNLKSNETIAKEVLNGLWGNGEDRKQRLKNQGYDYAVIQGMVNDLVNGKPTPTPKKSTSQVAREVVNGRWGNGSDRRNRLEKAGYNYNEIQRQVNNLINGYENKPRLKSNETIAREVLKGLWGNGQDRKNRLTKAGYNYNEVQRIVNRLA